MNPKKNPNRLDDIQDDDLREEDTDPNTTNEPWREDGGQAGETGSPGSVGQPSRVEEEEGIDQDEALDEVPPARI